MIKNSLKVLNNFVHDFASACWVACLLVIYWTQRTAAPSGTEAFFLRLKENFFFLGIGSLVVILATGVARTLTYENALYGPEFEGARKRMLILKHVIGFIVYGAGTYWQYRVVYG